MLKFRQQHIYQRKHVMKFSNLFLIALLFSFSACGLYQYNESDQKKLPDHRKNDAYVYGAEGDSARQLRNEYTDTPESAERAAAIRDKFFGDGKNSNGSNLQETSAPAADTTQKEAAQAPENGKKNS